MCLQLVQAAALLLHIHSLWVSNLIQMLLPVVAFVLCLWRRNEDPSGATKKDWTKLAVAFLFWTAAETLYLTELYLLPSNSTLTWPDDVLWLFFGLPILLATSGSPDGEKTPFGWLDHGQAFLFCAILLLSVFCTPHIFPFNIAYNAQNIALLLSCCLRSSVTTTPSTSRFYRDLSFYLFVYTFSAGIGNALQAKGWIPGSLVDLFWTVPLTLFCCLVSHQLNDEGRSSHKKGSRLSRLRRHVHGLSALALAVLSIGASAFAISRRPLLGWVSLTSAFTLFATRTIVKELELYKAHDEMKVIALRDALTGLGNRFELRRYLDELIASPERENFPFAVFFMDLDGFKAINDEFGHDAGDQLLVQVSNRLQDVVRPGDVVCRQGGDEFVVVMRLERGDSLELIGQRLLRGIQSTITKGSRSLVVTGSLGVVRGSYLETVQDLLHKADQAMYHAKNLGKNQVQMFADDRLQADHEIPPFSTQRQTINTSSDLAFSPSSVSMVLGESRQ